jgi:hypothetical protein
VVVDGQAPRQTQYRGRQHLPTGDPEQISTSPASDSSRSARSAPGGRTGKPRSSAQRLICGDGVTTAVISAPSASRMSPHSAAKVPSSPSTTQRGACSGGGLKD